ncbi:MAG: LuxR family transcriptional regulator, partial [Bacteroidia bacterium]|nr:LuxR family transcriptional regulator [Bacteroidia bacterium]
MILFGSMMIQISAQETPPINIFTPQQYNGENQNWSIGQADDKTIYIANSKGLLAYNGAQWDLYVSPNETIMRSVQVVGDRIYTGCYMEFGYWVKTNLGELTYTSLSENIGVPLIEDEEFWNIIELDNWILFQSLDRIYLYNALNGALKTIDSSTRITKMYEVNNSIYFQRFDNGIYKIENGLDILVSDHEILKSNIVVNIFDQDDQLLIETQDNGFFVLKNSELTAWDIPAMTTISNLSIYNSIQLDDGSFALGTISNGILHLSQDGKIVNQIDQDNGLSNNTVLSLLEDSDQNIWLGLDIGINCLNMTSAVRIFNDFKGKLGSVYCSAVYEGNLYLGTNQGLYTKPLNASASFTFIEGTQGQVWSLFKYDDQLFCGHNSGTFIVKNNTAEKISSIQGTWNIRPIENRPNLLLQGNYDGLYVLERSGNSWQVKNKINGFDISSRFFEFQSDRTLFVSHEYKGVFQIALNTDFTEALKVRTMAVSKGQYSSLTRFNNDLLYAFKKGVYTYDASSDRFVKDSTLSQIYNETNYISGKLITNEESNTLWSFSQSDLSMIRPGTVSSTPQINSIALPEHFKSGVSSYESILHLYDDNYLIGTSSGYIIIDLSKSEKKSYPVILNAVSSSTKKNKTRLIDPLSIGKFKNEENNLEFSYSVPNFNAYEDVKYQYQLMGIYDDWSDFSESNNVAFTNLPYGSYTFNVRAKTGSDLSTNTASYEFSIDRPFLLSYTMLAVYALGVILFSIFMHNIYKQYYKRQREKLLDQTKKELELKELENEQQRMRFKNENLELDIKSKN